MKGLLYNLQDLVDESIDFLRQHEPPEGYFVGFSGGKDSIVTLELCRMAGVKHEAYYSVTGIDPPEVMQFIRQHYPGIIWKRPRITMWEGIKKKSPPLIKRRWCCDELKKYPTKAVPLNCRIMGIRGEESSARASRPRIEKASWVAKGQILYKPIFSWLEWAIWEFIEQQGLLYPSLYDEGFDRIGCVVCPFIMGKNQTKLNRHKARWPGIYKAFEHAMQYWYENVWRDKEPTYKTFEEYLVAYYLGFPKPKGMGTSDTYKGFGFR